MGLSRRKLAIFAAISECLLHADAKYCAFEIHGEPKYYVCPRTEYCCNFGCCVSPGFQIYHLWYYWLLVIIMFLVCSGGGWWYRYWLQGRYRPSASAIPPRTSSSRAQTTLRGPTCRAQQARVTYNPARSTVLLHRMWKGPQRNATPPAYNGGAASSAQFQNTNVVLNDNNCPYYELYGPPPSYETVIAQTRSKITSPTTLEHSRPNAQTPSMQNQNAAHCFSHNYSSLPTRIHVNDDVNERHNSCDLNVVESENFLQNFSCKNFGQKCDTQQVLRLKGDTASDNCYQESTASGTRPQNISTKLPFCMTEDRPESSNSEATLQNSKSSPDAFTVIKGNCSGNSSAEYNPSAACASSQFSQNNSVISPDIIDMRSIKSCSAVKETDDVMRINELEMGMVNTEKPSNENDTRPDSVSRISKMFTHSKNDAFGVQHHRAQSSSLKERPSSSRWTQSIDRYCNLHRCEESGAKDKRMEVLGSSKNGFETTQVATTLGSKKLNSDCEKCIAQNDGSISELNPSNIVILPSSNPNVQNNSLPPIINIIENYQHYPPTSSPAQRSDISTNFESENKLGRSKSLD